jgi:predicted dehydrogenase
VAVLGVGGVSLANHIPGLLLCPGVDVLALADPDPAALERGLALCPKAEHFADPFAAIDVPGVDAVVIATPNITHKDLAVQAARQGKHILCEKPLTLTLADARAMHAEASRAGVRHMTAFTYRFVPGMRYLKQLLDEGFAGRILHLRAKRLQDWGTRPLGWRQRTELAGTGELGDMLAHRLDFGHLLAGPIVRGADFLLESYAPGYLDELGLGYREMSAINPLRLDQNSGVPLASFMMGYMASASVANRGHRLFAVARS